MHNPIRSAAGEGTFVISGTLSNRSGAAIAGVQITYNLYGESGALLGQASATNEDYFGPLKPTW